MKATYGERSNGAEREQRSAVEPTFGRVRTEWRCGFRRWGRGGGRSLPAPRRLRRNVPTAGRDNTAMRCRWRTPFWRRWDASRILDGLLVAVLSHRLIRSLCSLRRLPFLKASGVAHQLHKRLPFGLRFALQSYPPNRLIKFLFVGSRTLLHHFLHPYRY